MSAGAPAISPSHPRLSTPSGGSILEWWAFSVSPIHPLGHWAHVNVMNYWENGYYWLAVGIIEGVNCSERPGRGLEGGGGSLHQRAGQHPQARFKYPLRHLTSRTVRSEVERRTWLTFWQVDFLLLVPKLALVFLFPRPRCKVKPKGGWLGCLWWCFVGF